MLNFDDENRTAAFTPFASLVVLSNVLTDVLENESRMDYNSMFWA